MRVGSGRGVVTIRPKTEEEGVQIDLKKISLFDSRFIFNR